MGQVGEADGLGQGEEVVDAVAVQVAEGYWSPI